MTRKNLRNPRHSAAHLARLIRHHSLWATVLFVCMASATLLAVHATTLPAQKKPSPNDGILYVTVFTEKGARFPDVAYTAHPAGKTKPRWEGYSDMRGEFAVRVSVQGEYEIEVKAKGYDPQTRKVTSEVGDKTDVVFNLVPKAPKKP